MAKYKIIPSSMTIVQSPISIGHKAEKGVEAIEFDLTAWVETYGSGTLTVIMRRWGDAIPYPIALEIDENNKAVWTLSDTDTAKAGMAYAQLSYIVGNEVVKKSDIYTFRVMDSLTGEGEPPEAYESWLEHLTHLAAEAMAEVLDIESIVTDKTLTVDGGVADAKATGEALAEKVDAADYSSLSARVGANTIALAEKADRSTTYTKTEVDTLIESVDVETDTTLSVTGKPADAKKTGDEITALKADLGVNSRNILPKQPTMGAITVIDFGEEKTFTNGVNISFDLLAFTGNGSAGIITLRNASDTVVATVTLNGMRNVDTGKAYSEESSPHSGRYSSYAITALQSSLTFRYVRVVLNANVVTSGGINNFMLTDGHYPSSYVPTFKAKDYDLETLANPIELNTAVNTISLMDSSFWAAKNDYYRMSNGGMTQSAGTLASRLFPCKAGDTLSYKLYMPSGTKVLFTFDQNMQIVNTVDALGTAVAVSGTHTFTATERYFAFNCMKSQLIRMYVKYNDIPVAIRNYVADYVSGYADGKERFPDYWNATIQSAVETIKTNLLSLTSGDAFFFVTDQHWVGNAKYSSPIIDYISSQTGIYNVFIGGDIVNNKNTSKLGAMAEMLTYLASFQNPNIRLFSTLGNHDRNSVAQTDQSLWLSLEEQYNSLIKPEEKWLDTGGTPLCNVYNNDSQKIRYIQFFFTLDSGYREDVATLLTAAMQSAPAGWTIILMSHAYWDGANPSQGAESYANLIQGLLDSLNAEAPLWIVGHTHADRTTVITSLGGKTMRIISTTTDSVGQNPSNPSMAVGTTTEQAFDVYCIDTTAKTINTVRIGAGENRSFTY